MEENQSSKSIEREPHPDSSPPECFHCERVFTEDEVEKVCKGLVPGKTETREFFCPACGCWTPMKVCIE